MNCRGCGGKLSQTFLDLGESPIANNLIAVNSKIAVDTKYPLKVMVCNKCAFVQLSEDVLRTILFPENYLYHSSYSSTWLAHCENYTQYIINLLDLKNNDLVVEIASNDGYLLQYFAKKRINVLGIEPSQIVAEVARKKNIPTLVNFFGKDLAKNLEKGKKPRLIIGNNVLAHVPDVHDFIEGLALLLDDEGLITLEFPHINNLIMYNQFDTIYHEHLSYLSLTALNPIFIKYKLKAVKVQKLDTHGGSLRVHLAKSNSRWEISTSVIEVFEEEALLDPRSNEVMDRLKASVLSIKENLISELQTFKKAGFKIAAYGAAAKGVSLLNYCDINSDVVKFVVDRNPFKQGKMLPGVNIEVVGVEKLLQDPPDVVLVLPWNLSNEIKVFLQKELGLNPILLRAIPRVERF